MMIRRLLTRLAVGIAVTVGAGVPMVATSASAQVRYAPNSDTVFPFGSPYDEGYDTHPFYQIIPNRYGPVVHVIQRCAYLGGWNTGDFSRDVNGIPLGVDHTCPDEAASGRVRARY